MILQHSRTGEIWYIERSAPSKGKIHFQSLTIEVDDPESRLRIPTKFLRSCAIKMAQNVDVHDVFVYNEEENDEPEEQPTDPVRDHSRRRRNRRPSGRC
jgi:hypothetical protein